MPDYAGKGLRFASKGCHSSPGFKAWGFLAWLIKNEKSLNLGYKKSQTRHSGESRSPEPTKIAGFLLEFTPLKNGAGMTAFAVVNVAVYKSEDFLLTLEIGLVFAFISQP
jgi:hypothetical protein